MKSTIDILKSAKAASQNAMLLEPKEKKALIKALAKAISDHRSKILEANKIDIEVAKNKLNQSMIDRLTLNIERIDDMVRGMLKVAELDDPVGRVLQETTLENGLLIKKVSVPLGVVSIIYESRPNVTSDASCICLKSGNACVLRGGKEAFNTSYTIVEIMRETLAENDVDQNIISMIEDTSRQSANEIMKSTEYVDLLIPRGGKGLIEATVKNSLVPCIQTGTGICHIYVDMSAGFEMALDIIENAKTSRPSVCNAQEVLLVHEDIASDFLPLLKERLCGNNAKHKVELRGDEAVCNIIDIKRATKDDFDTEFLDYILAIAIVDDVKCACEHIEKHSTHHSEAIITNDDSSAKYFLSFVDSAAVYVNASTRFTDGGQFGQGAEMGISTQKLHARGPFGVEELTTYKYEIFGNGQIRS